MFGLISKITAVDGQRDALSKILFDGTRDMPNNVSYVVAPSTEDENLIWVTEVWADQSSHTASLQLPAVQEAIAVGRPLIAGMERVATTHPVG